MSLQGDFQKRAEEYPRVNLERQQLEFEEQFLMALYQVLQLNEVNAKSALSPKVIESCEAAFDLLGAASRILDSLKVVPANN